MFAIFSHYPTFLVFLAIVAAIVVTMVLMPVWIKFLKSSHIGQQVRADGPESHLVKQGTPTMGGVIMLVAVIATALVIGMPTPETFLLLGATVLTGLLGLVDDASKVVKERSLGLTPKAKLVGQFAIATVFTLVAVNWLGVAPTVEIPFVYTFDLGLLTTVVPVGDGIAIPWLYLIFANILLVGMCNAVNLTDGLDGLATGVSVPIVAVLGVLAYLSGHIVYADYLNIMYIPGSGEMVVFAAALVGALVGFLWYNSFPAQIFMGDTGSLAIGGVIAVFALCIRKELLLPLLCGVFLVESFSVMMQVGWFKYTKRRYGEGRRILLMSPVHHHYQKKGIFETKIVLRFWIISLLLAAITLVTLKIR